MEVLVGPRSYASTAYAIDPTKDASPPPPPCLFIKEEDGGGEIRNRLGSGFSGKSSEEEEEEEDSSDSDNSSSIGVPGDSDDDEEEVSSQSQARGGLASLDALDDSLPIKRGLSNHYKGKSKSFGNLSDVSLTSISVKDIIEKPENALNKRRRVLIANKRARKSFYSWQNPKSMPILTSLNEHQDDDDDYDDQIFNNNKLEMDSSYKSPDQHRLRHPLSFKSKSCFSLADLQEEDEDEDEDEDQ